MAGLTIKNVSKVFPNGFAAVKNFNMEIMAGEEVVIVGPPGCGKSTILRMIAGLEEISEGEILIDGVRVNEVPIQDREIAMMFRNGVLYPGKTVAENMSFSLEMRHDSKDEIERTLRETAEFLGITDLMDRMPGNLTEQQRQLVAVGRAMAKKAAVYLFDDPLSNLDENLRRKVRKDLIEIHKKGSRTVVYVTDNQEEAMELGTRIVVMNDGVVQQIGTPEEIYHHPANKFVAEYIGNPTMNLLDAQVEQKGDCAVLLLGEYRQVLPEGMSEPLLRGGYVGKAVIIGIRPEDIYGGNKTGAGTEGAVMEGIVRVYEQPRDDVSLYFDVKGTNLTVLTSPETKVRPGDKVGLFPDMDRLHAFDKETGIAIF